MSVALPISLDPLAGGDHSPELWKRILICIVIFFFKAAPKTKPGLFTKLPVGTHRMSTVS